LFSTTGSAVAAKKVLIDGSDIKNGSITAADIKDGTLTARELGEGPITLDRLSDGTQRRIDEKPRDGKDGANGVNGKDGTNGVNGNDGATGAAGAKGEAGGTGAAGAKGDKGDQGIPGPTGAQGPAGPQGTVGPQGAKGTSGAMPEDFNVTNSSVRLTQSGLQFGAYADGGAAGGSLYYEGLNGKTLKDIAKLYYTAKYTTDNDVDVAVPYPRVFLNGDTTDVIFSPNTQPTPDTAEGVSHKWVVTDGTVRYGDDAGNGPRLLLGRRCGRSRRRRDLRHLRDHRLLGGREPQGAAHRVRRQRAGVHLPAGVTPRKPHRRMERAAPRRASLMSTRAPGPRHCAATGWPCAESPIQASARRPGWGRNAGSTRARRPPVGNAAVGKVQKYVRHERFADASGVTAPASPAAGA
jgi:hypothetical protein